MAINRLILTDFRNYERAVWSARSSITVLTGANGAGKTNLLEAVSLLSPGRGMRASPLHQLCRTEADRWGVAATFTKDGTTFTLGTGAGRHDQKRSFQVDGRPVRSQTEIAPYVSCVWLTPQMDRLFQDSASGRRRFLDRLVMALIPDHAREVHAHDRSVTSRNRILAEQPQADMWLNATEDSIARHATAVTAARVALIEHMNARAGETGAFPTFTLGLACPIAKQLVQEPALKVEDALRSRLRQSRSDDQNTRQTTHGAHRADFTLADKATDRSADLSSSGQQKTLLVGVVLVHALLIAQLRGAAPILLLDEPLVHLDDFHRHTLLECVSRFQSPVFMTGTDRSVFGALQDTASFVRVGDGQLASAVE